MPHREVSDWVGDESCSAQLFGGDVNRGLRTSVLLQATSARRRKPTSGDRHQEPSLDKTTLATAVGQLRSPWSLATVRSPRTVWPRPPNPNRRVKTTDGCPDGNARPRPRRHINGSLRGVKPALIGDRERIEVDNSTYQCGRSRRHPDKKVASGIVIPLSDQRLAHDLLCIWPVGTRSHKACGRSGPLKRVRRTGAA
jgi:hypothetical protein